jgi:hypothetical protein
MVLLFILRHFYSNALSIPLFTRFEAKNRFYVTETQILAWGAEKFLRLVIEAPNHTMTTLLPPPSKRAKLAGSSENQIDLSTVTGNVLVQFKASDTGEITGTTVRIPARTTARELELLLNQLLNNVDY